MCHAAQGAGISVGWVSAANDDAHGTQSRPARNPTRAVAGAMLGYARIDVRGSHRPVMAALTQPTPYAYISILEGVLH